MVEVSGKTADEPRIVKKRLYRVDKNIASPLLFKLS